MTTNQWFIMIVPLYPLFKWILHVHHKSSLNGYTFSCCKLVDWTWYWRYYGYDGYEHGQYGYKTHDDDEGDGDDDDGNDDQDAATICLLVWTPIFPLYTSDWLFDQRFCYFPKEYFFLGHPVVSAFELKC